jgi:hypothetical protein
MRPMRNRLSALLLLLSLLLAGCSTLSLGYNQLPRLAAWWIDGYLDLDREQGRQLDAALQELHTWHRREELPRWQALLAGADSLWDGGVSEAELLALEAEAAASIERTLARAAPLATPLLAGLRPAQWERLQRRLRERLEEWREQQLEEDAAHQRGKRFARSLSRWLGDLERPLRRAAHQQAEAWPMDAERLAGEWAARQRKTLDGLRAWAQGDAASGLQLLLAAGGRGPQALGPTESARRQAVMGSLLQLLNAASPAQQAEARARWAAWREQLAALR